MTRLLYFSLDHVPENCNSDKAQGPENTIWTFPETNKLEPSGDEHLHKKGCVLGRTAGYGKLLRCHLLRERQSIIRIQTMKRSSSERREWEEQFVDRSSIETSSLSFVRSTANLSLRGSFLLVLTEGRARESGQPSGHRSKAGEVSERIRVSHHLTERTINASLFILLIKTTFFTYDFIKASYVKHRHLK